MSDTPMELARDIVNLIMESESYLRYKSALEQIISTPEQLEKLKEVMGDYEKEQIKKDMAVQEAVTLVAESAKVVEKKEEKAE